MSFSRHVFLLAASLACGFGATGATAQDRFYERFGNWTVVWSETLCTALGTPTPFPDGTMPPWQSVNLTMSDPFTMEVRYSGDIAADAPRGEQEGQVLLRSLDGKTDYFRPRMVVAGPPGDNRMVTAYLEGEVLEALPEYDYFLLRAGSQMLPLGLVPHRDALLETMRRCVERF